MWAETHPESLLRKWVVDATITGASEADFGRRLASFPQEFKDEVLMELIQQKPRADDGAFCKKTTEHFA